MAKEVIVAEKPQDMKPAERKRFYDEKHKRKLALLAKAKEGHFTSPVWVRENSAGCTFCVRLYFGNTASVKRTASRKTRHCRHICGTGSAFKKLYDVRWELV